MKISLRELLVLDLEFFHEFEFLSSKIVEILAFEMTLINIRNLDTRNEFLMIPLDAEDYFRLI